MVLFEDANQNAESQPLSPIVWVAIGLVAAVLLVLGIILALNKRRVFEEPLDGAIRVKTPKANKAILYVFAGVIAVGNTRRDLGDRDWVDLTASIRVKKHPLYTRPGPVLTVIEIAPAEPPEEEVATFY